MAGLLISIRRGISIEGALPNAQAGVAIHATLTADGAEYGVDWTVSGTLPPGLRLAVAGEMIGLGGIPTTPGTYTVTFSAVDGRGYHATRSYTMRITEADALMATDGDLIAPRDLLGRMATVGEAYDVQITPIGGVPPYTWAVKSGSLPSGLTFSTSTGKITGTPTAENYVDQLTVTLTDAASHSVDVILGPISQNFEVVVTGYIPTGVRGKPYSFQLFKTPPSPYDHVWSITSGTLPQGLALQPDGEINGVPEVTTAVTNVTVKCVSSGGASDTAPVTIVVDPATITVDVDTPVTVNVGDYFNPIIAISGGSGGYHAELTTGSLPPGFELSSYPTLRYPVQIVAFVVPEAAVGTHDFTLRVSDGFGNYADVPMTINVVVGPLELEADDDGQWTGTVGRSFNRLNVKEITAHGGLAPFVWALDSGTLPPGLSLFNGGNYAYLNGTPTTAGTYTATIRATDSQSPADTATVDITVTINP